MILSSCHHYSLNNDCRCDCHCCCHCHSMQRIYVYFISPCLALPCVELTSITIVIIGMTLYDLVLHYIIISYHIISHVLLLYLFCWFDLHCILFYSILFNFISNRFDLILFFFISLNLIYCIVQYSISYQWMICVYLSVHPSVCPSVRLSLYLFTCMNKFMFSLLSCFFILSLLFLFSFHFHFSFFTLFSLTSSSHTHGHGHTQIIHWYEILYWTIK